MSLVKHLLIVFVGVTLLSACEEEGNSQALHYGGGRMALAEVGMAAPSADMQVARKASSMAMDRTKLGERKIAETHNLSIQVEPKQLDNRYQRDLQKCHEIDCVLINGSVRNRSNASLILRLKPEVLPGYLDYLQEGEGRITNHAVSADDKTFEYIDTMASLENSVALRERLRKLLDSPKTDKIGEILQVERELSRVQREIDNATQRKRFLEKQTDFATVHINYSVPHRMVEIKYYDLKNSFRNAWVGFIRSLADVIELTGKVLPMIPLLFIGFWLVVKMFRFAFGRGFFGGLWVKAKHVVVKEGDRLGAQQPAKPKKTPKK